MPVKPIPDGYHSLTPYLIVRNAAAAIDYYKTVFDAVELLRMPGPGGRIGHAEVRIGDSPLMLADEHPEVSALGPQESVRPPVQLLLYVEDVDTVFARAVAAGATVVRAVQDQFYGDRMGTLTDPFGHLWSIATHTEDLTHEELRERAMAAGKPSE